MYDWSVPVSKQNNDPSRATAWRVQELLETYNAVPAQTMSTGATMPDAENATAGNAETLALIQKIRRVQ